jgi:hypothetical protein
MKLNLNTILLVLGGLGVFAPGIASVAAWLASMNISWLGTVVKGLGLLAAFCSAAPLVIPRLRSFLALLGLATPPGAVAPWNPTRDAGPVPPVALVPSATPPSPVTPPSGTRRTGPGSSNLGVLVFLVSSLLATAALAQTAPLDCGPLGVAVNSLNICIVPSTAGGQVFNLKTGSVTNIALLVGIAAIHQDNLSLGAGFYCGADLALSTPNGFMCAGLVSIKNYGAFGGGFSSYHDSLANQQIFQGLVMVAGTLHFGGTPSTLAARRDEKAAAELDYYVRGLKDGTALKSVGK